MKRIIVQHRTADWIAYLEDRPGTWEAANTRNGAIGALVWTYFKCFPEQWPEISITEKQA